MRDHTVHLHYGPNGLDAPQRIKIKHNQTIAFELAPPIQGGKLKITFRNPELFSAAHFQEGDQDIKVTGTPFHTFYKCELFVSDVLVSSRDGADGGEMVPDTGNM